MVFELEQEDESVITPMALAHILHPLEACRGISAKTFGLDDVFPPDDLGSGPYSQLRITYIPCIIAAF